MKKIFSNLYFRYSAFAIGGLFFGWLFFHSPHKVEESHNHATEEKKSEIWTCAMHPQIRMDKPGKCPICAMDLILLNQSGESGMDPEAIHLTKEAAQLANVQTSVVAGQQPVKEVRLYGKVQSDERMIQSQVAYIPGRIEKLLVNFTGESVRKGQTLAVIYSPELVTAQQELLETVKSKQSQPELYEAAKEKLRQWKLSDSQIDAVETSGVVKANMEIKSTTNGIITSRRINSGDYVNQGTLLFEVSDLSHVWVQFDAYESDIQFLNRGNKLDFTFQALPGENYSGNIAFIDPSIDPVTRIAKVRVEINNPSGKFKPEMFATGIVKARMDEFRDKMVIPRSAVLWTGKRSVVYVKLPGNEPVFKIREIDLGPVIGDNYIVTGGLTKDEEIVTQGVFSVDAASQLEGKPSMMSQESNPPSQGSMPGMDMGPGSSENGSASAMPAQTEQYKEITFQVAGSCEMCKDRIEKVVKSVAGIKSADWKIATKMLTVQLDESKTGKEALQKAIALAGHDTGKFKAPDDVYKMLPECCLYRPK